MRKQRLCLAAGVLALCLAACAPAISAQQAAAPASLPSSSRVEIMESNLTSLPPSSAVQQPESSSLPASSAAESTESTPPSSAAPQASRPDSFRLADFPVLYQMPELPTGCEITALTMVLHFYGYPVDKTTMAADYLPKARANLHEGADGRLYGGDLRNYFIGDPFTEAGYICGTGAIVTAANTYLQDAGSSLQAVDESGATPEQLYDFVSEGHAGCRLGHDWHDRPPAGGRLVHGGRDVRRLEYERPRGRPHRLCARHGDHRRPARRHCRV